MHLRMILGKLRLSRLYLVFLFLVIFSFVSNLLFTYWMADVPPSQSAPQECPLPGPLAVSAMSRMKTEQCKNELRSIACKMSEGTFHEKFPITSCTNYDSKLEDVYVGCLEDSPSNRVLTGHSYTWKDDNSKEKCALHCYRAGHVYYGMEFGKECFCGDTLIMENKLPEERCSSHPCTGGSSTCGGFNAIQVYRTGITGPIIWPKPVYVEVEKGKEYSVVILFLLQLNGRNVRQVRQMLKGVYSQRHHYYIHVDSRQKYMLREAHRLASILPNIYVAPFPRSTIWGGASLLPMFIDAIKFASNLRWDYIINMSESDQIILSLSELEAQLEKNMGSTFLASHGQATGRFIEKQGVDYVFLECEQRMWRVARIPSVPRHLGITGGSDWVVVHRGLADYAANESEELSVKLRRLFTNNILPLEIFFHSLALNSRYCHSIIGGNLKITSWERKQGCRCASLKKVVDWCGCSPIALASSTSSKFSVERAKERGAYFARKFDSLVSSKAIFIARMQASRLDEVLSFDPLHPRILASFVNIYDSEIDDKSEEFSSFLLGLAEKRKVKELNIMKESDESEIQLVVVYNGEEGEHRERLFDIGNEYEVDKEIEVNGFVMDWIRVGVSIDHKEEIFRGYSRFIPITGSATVLMEWSKVNGEENEKTSPEVKLEWRNEEGRLMAAMTIPAYDSTRGRQFGELDIGGLNATEGGVWTVTVFGDNKRIASSSFPVFTTDPMLTSSLTHRFYPLQDECSTVEDCTEKEWSSLFPDPNSDIKGLE